MLAGEADSVHKLAIVTSRGSNGRELALVVHAVKALGQDDHAVARDVVLLQSFADNLLGSAMGVDVGLRVFSVHCIARQTVTSCQLTVSQVLIPCL